MPVFSELLEEKKKREAYQLAAALAGLLLVALTLITIVVHPARAGDRPARSPATSSRPALDDLCIGLSQVLFPIVILLGLTGLAVGVLNVHDHFTIPAIAPLVWNVVIIAGMVGLAPLFEGDDQLYAYAIGVVAGTLVQLLMMLPALRRIGFPVCHIRLPKRGDVRVRRVLMLMLPVSVGLGLININLLLNSTIGSIVSDQVPRAIDAAFRIYMLPQGMFSVAVATVLFPQLARLAARRDYAGLQATIGVGLRQIALLLIPAGAAMLVLSEPMVRLVYRARGVRRRIDEADRRGAVLVQLQPPVQRLGADAHARVLLAAAAVDPDDARRRLARDQRDRLLRAGQADGDRRHRARHDALQRRARGRRGGDAPARARRLRDARGR